MVKLYIKIYIFDKLAPLDQRQDIFPFSRIRTTKKFSRFGISNQLSFAELMSFIWGINLYL